MTEMVSTLAGYVGASGAGGTPPFVPGAGGGEGGFNIKALTEFGTSFASAAMSVFGAEQQAGALRAQSAAQARGLELQARQSTLEARQAENQGRQESLQIMDNLVQTIAAQRLAFAGNGMDPFFGTGLSVAEGARQLADRQVSVSRSDAAARALARRTQAASYLAQGAAARASGNAGAQEILMKGRTQAFSTMQEYSDRRERRG